MAGSRKAVDKITKRSEARRELLIHAATQLFSRYGFRHTSMERIAEEAGTAKATAYAYFPNKEEAFRAVCDAVAQKLVADAEATLAASGGGVAGLTAMFRQKFLAIYELVHRSPHAREILETTDRIAGQSLAEAHARFVTLVADVLAQLRGVSRRANVDRELGELLDAAAEGIAQRAPSPAELERRIGALIELAHGGWRGYYR